MAKKFLTPLGLVGLTSDPASGSEGQLYFNTTDDVVRVYANGAWTELSGSGGASVYYQAEAPDGAELGALWVDSDSTGTGGSGGGGSGTSLLFWTEDSDGNLIPDVDNISSIGSSAYRVKDLYLGASSLYLQNPASASANISLSVDSSGNLKINDSKIITESNANNNLNLTNYATLQYAQSASAAAVSYLVDSAPGALDTLNELANALGDDQNFATTVTNSLSSKLSIQSASATYATKQDLANIDLSNYITASAASATYQKLIPFSSASPTSPSSGSLWVDSTNSGTILKIWDGTTWQVESFVPIPTITSISPSSFNGAAGTSIEINGTNFQSGAAVAFIGTNAAVNNATVVVRNSATLLTATTPTLNVANEPYSVRVINPGGQSAILATALDAGSTPTWTTASGSLGTIYDVERGVKTFTVVATDADSQSLTYSLSSGTLPTGMTINSNGTITGTPSAVGSDTTFTFVIAASDGINSSTRSFSITIGTPVSVTFTTVGSNSWTAPAGLTRAKVLLIGGGGGAGNNRGNGGGGYGGGGGIIYSPSTTITGGTTYTIVVGSAGSGGACNNQSGCSGGVTTGFGGTAGNGGGGVSEYNGNCNSGWAGTTTAAGATTTATDVYAGGTGGCSFGAGGGGTQYSNAEWAGTTTYGGTGAAQYYGGGGSPSGGGGTQGIARIKY